LPSVYGAARERTSRFVDPRRDITLIVKDAPEVDVFVPGADRRA